MIVGERNEFSSPSGYSFRGVNNEDGAGVSRGPRGSYNEFSDGRGRAVLPILLDVDGDGVQIAELSRSTVFMDATGDGLANRTAWAAAGNGVLFYDADGGGVISQKREYVFTEWDPTATSDMEALASYFDSMALSRFVSGPFRASVC